MFPIRDGVAIRYVPVVTWSLIAGNCAIFLFQITLSETGLEAFLLRFALIPARYFDAPAYFAPSGLVDYLPFLSNTFLHGGWLHLILNMWSLWIFGPAVEDRLGPTAYLVFYLAAGIAASIAHAIFNPTSDIPALGASGAIAGVIGCYVRMFPRARLIVVVPIIFIPLFFAVPAVVFAAIWFALQIIQAVADFFGPTQLGGVAWWAHVGGFVFGALIAPVIRRSGGHYRPMYGDEGIYGLLPDGRR